MRKSLLTVLMAALSLGQVCGPPAVLDYTPEEQPASRFVSSTIPSTMTVGQTTTVHIVFENGANTPWTRATGYVLGAVGDSDSFAANVQELAESDSIAAGQQKTFTVQFTAPTAPGSYATDWRMRRDAEWFGDTLTRTVTVLPFVTQPPVDQPPSAPTITASPAAATACPGETVTFSVASSGSGLSYQWQKDGTSMTEGATCSGVTTATLTVSSASVADAGNYRCLLSNAGGSAASEAAALSVRSVTSITEQPAAQTVGQGGTATFSVTATGAQSYQWQKNGTNISGATTATLQINAVTPSDAADYRCVVTGDCGTAPSSSAALTVNPLTTITQQPAAQNVCPGGTATFNVVGTGYGVLSYQWQKNGTNIGGATAATLQITNCSGAAVANYRCVVTGGHGTATSNSAALTLKASTVITQQPASQVVCEGDTATFNVAATGYGVLTYQWQKDSVNIGGATAAALQISHVTAGDAASYRCIVTGGCGAATSSSAALTVSLLTTITQQPDPQVVCVGDTATFTVAASGEGTLSYQWQKDDSDIGGATSATLQLLNVSAADAANYRCLVTGGCGTTASSEASLVVNAITAITLQPALQDLCLGGTATFAVTATGTGLTYQWKKDDVDLSDGGNISGATGATLQVSSVALSDAGNYRCVVTGLCGADNSSTAALTLKAQLAISQQPAAQQLCLGGTATFNVAGTGEAPLSYQWRKGGVDLSDGGSISGAQTDALQIAGVTAGDVANYTCVVTDGCGFSATSDPAALSLFAAPTIAGADPLALTADINSACDANQVALSATDPDTAPELLAWSIKTAPAHGTIAFVGGVNTGGNVTLCYTPTPDQYNVDRFVIEVTDGCGGTDDVTVNVNALVEHFDYADQTAFRAVWNDTGSSVYYFDVTSGNSGGCVVMPSPPSNNLGRYYHNLGHDLNGSDAAPLVMSYDLWLDPAGAPGWNGSRDFVEFRGYSGNAYGSGTLEAMVAVGVNNAAADGFSTLRYQGRVVYGVEWQTLDEGSAPVRSAGWHQMKIKVTTSQVKFYVDGILSETEARPNSYGFDCVAIGSNLTSNGWTFRVDNLQVTCGE